RGLTSAAHVIDPVLHLLDPVADDAPVRLELALARSPRADATLGSRKVRPEPRQARELVLELRQLDLQPALVRARVLGEDGEDHAAPVDDLDLDELLERSLLRRRELVVGDEQVEAGLGLGGHELLGLALADVPVWVDMASVLPLGADDFGACGQGEVGQLGQRVLGIPAGRLARVDGDEERLLGRRLELDQLWCRHRGRIPAPLRLPEFGPWRIGWSGSSAGSALNRPRITTAGSSTGGASEARPTPIPRS